MKITTLLAHRGYLLLRDFLLDRNETPGIYGETRVLLNRAFREITELRIQAARQTYELLLRGSDYGIETEMVRLAQSLRRAEYRVSKIPKNEST